VNPGPYVFGSPGSGSVTIRMDPDPSIIASSSKKSKKNLDFYCFETYL
jgi:hypothetical protein